MTIDYRLFSLKKKTWNENNMFVFCILVWYPGVTMPQPKGDQVFFVVHQRQEDPTEIVAHLVKQDGLDDLKEYMVESGSVK